MPKGYIELEAYTVYHF